MEYLLLVMLLMYLSLFHTSFCFEQKLQVVKNVASQSLEVKKLVYLYLLHYAEKYVYNSCALCGNNLSSLPTFLPFLFFFSSVFVCVFFL